MIPFEVLMVFVLASALLALTPGPDNLFVLVQSALYGKKAGVLITLGLCTGLIVHTSVVALGAAAFIMDSTVMLILLKSAGACYLLYLSWQMIRAKAEQIMMISPVIYSNWALYRRGIIMNVTNPKVTLFFLSFLPQFVMEEQGLIALQVLFLGLVFIVVAFCIFSLIAILSGRLGEWLKGTPIIQIYLNRVCAGLFVLMAIYLVWT